MKEFVAAGSVEKEALYAKIEEEVGKLTGSSARLSSLFGLLDTLFWLFYVEYFFTLSILMEL